MQRRILSLILAFSMVLSFFTIDPSHADAAKKKATVKMVSLTKPKKTDVLVLKKGAAYSLKTSVQVSPNTKANKKVNYRSSNAKVVSVNKKGTLKAKKKGKATITATSAQNKKKKAKLKVQVGTPIQKISVASSLSLNVNEAKTLKLTYSPKKPSYTKVSWQSSNAKVATVSKSGKVTAKKAGTANVSATSLDGSNKKAVCKVTVASNATPEPTPSEPAIPISTKIPMEELPLSNTFAKSIQAPDLLTMWNGTKVTTKEQWEERRQEIKNILQRYLYGIWRDGTGETLSYTVSGNTLSLTISRDGKQASFDATISKPSAGTAPEGGWPVIVAIGGVSNDYISQKGYSTISIPFNAVSAIASDNTNRTGAFYTLYPYDASNWKEQTGSVMAWAWGASKILDALAQGAGAELGISPTNTIVTGVSRYGKAAAAAGAFDERFKVSMPVCSGYGGMTMGRYNSNNLVYNLLPEFANDPKKDNIGNLAEWKSTGGNEPITSLQGSGWFNEAYKGFATYQNVPFDAHYLSALSAMEGRYLFIVTGINSDMWSSPPGFWWNYQEAKPAFDLIGLSDNLAIQMHLDLHGIETEDLVKLFTYTDYHFYGKTTDPSTYPAPWNTLLANFQLDDLKTCIFASEANKEAYQAGMPVDRSTATPNPDTMVNVEIQFGEETIQSTVRRSSASDAKVSELTGDQAGKGFTFQYGPEQQYGKSYAVFDLNLPEGKALSDYTSVSFTCQTDSNYYGKRMSLIAVPKTTGLPEEVDYDYSNNAFKNVTSLSGGKDFPSNTIAAQNLSMNIDKAAAESLGEGALEFSLYIHMECLDGSAQYTITNISFNP